MLADIEGLRPLVRDGDIVAFGYRDADQQREYGSQDIRDTGIHALPLEQVRKLTAAVAAERAVGILQRGGVAGLWIHLDAMYWTIASCRRWTTACRAG